MKTASGSLITLLNSGTQFYMADLLSITPVGGSAYRYNSSDIDLTFGGNNYTRDVIFVRGSIRTQIGLEVDTLDITFYANDQNLIGSQPFLQAVANGVIDGADVTMRRAFLSSWTATGIVDAIISFGGRVSDIEVSRTEARIIVKSDLELLNIKLPRNMYQPGCVHTLYDAGCGLSKSATAGTTTSGSTTSTLNSALGNPANWFDLGTVTFTSGQNNGLTRSVKSFSAGVFQLSYPLPYAPQTGDTFNAYPGCDKKQTTCSTKFSNVANFRGFPYIPIPESSV